MRRPRWSLRALLAVVSLLCIWLGHQVHVVHERREAVRMIEDCGGQVSDVGHDPYTYRDFSDPPTQRISLTRRLLGDKGVGYVMLPETMPLEERAALQRLFPEATLVIEFDDHGL